MCADFFRGSKQVSVCRGRGCSPGVFMCLSASAVCSHLVTLARQSIKWRGPLSHQGAVHDCQRLDAQKFAPPRRASPLRGKDSSVTQTTVPIHNDRCALWLKWMSAPRLNSKYIQGRRHIARTNCWYTCLMIIYLVCMSNKFSMPQGVDFQVFLFIFWCTYFYSFSQLNNEQRENYKKHSKA